MLRRGPGLEPRRPSLLPLVDCDQPSLPAVEQRHKYLLPWHGPCSQPFPWLAMVPQLPSALGRSPSPPALWPVMTVPFLCFSPNPLTSPQVYNFYFWTIYIPCFFLLIFLAYLCTAAHRELVCLYSWATFCYAGLLLITWPVRLLSALAIPGLRPGPLALPSLALPALF